MSVLGVIVGLIAGIYLVVNGNWFHGLILAPASALYSLAMFHVFQHAARDD